MDMDVRDEAPARSLADVDPEIEEYDIVDADVHVYDAFADLAEYVPDDSPWRRRFEETGRTSVGNQDSISSFFPASVGSRPRFGRIKRDHDLSAWDKDALREAMEYLSADDAILVGMQMLMYGAITGSFEDGRMLEHAKAYTRNMLDTFVDPADGAHMVLPAPYLDPYDAAEFVDDYADEPGVIGTCMITPGAEPPLGNRKYDPIYEATQDAGLPIVYHSGGAGLDEYHGKGYEKFIETHTLGFMNANLSQLTSVVIQGVPERFPDLDFVLVESGIAYVVALMYRLDAEYMKRQSEAPYLERLPSEYMKEDFYYGTQPLEETPTPEELEQLMRMMGGPDNLIYASDYPHWDYDPPSTIVDLPFLTEDEKQRVLADNAREVFDL